MQVESKKSRFESDVGVVERAHSDKASRRERWSQAPESCLHMISLRHIASRKWLKTLRLFASPYLRRLNTAAHAVDMGHPLNGIAVVFLERSVQMSYRQEKRSGSRIVAFFQVKDPTCLPRGTISPITHKTHTTTKKKKVFLKREMCHTTEHVGTLLGEGWR